MRSSLIALLFLSFTAQAEVVTTIHDIIAPEVGENTYLALATDRKVYEIAADNAELVSKLFSAKEAGSIVHMDVKASLSEDEMDTVLAMELKNIEFESEIADFTYNKDAVGVPTPMDGYTPSVLSSMSEASRYFRSMRGKTKSRSQCYNRAHVWSFELARRFGFKGKKVWIYFTRKYIRAYRWKWWFHVSPSTEVAGQTEEILLDRKFTSGPVTLTNWKNEFIKNKAHCPEITTYSQYSQNQQSEYCYVMKSSMYYWQPFQIEDLEKGEAPRRGWVEFELNRAYKNAISWWHRGVDL